MVRPKWSWFSRLVLICFSERLRLNMLIKNDKSAILPHSWAYCYDCDSNNFAQMFWGSHSSNKETDTELQLLSKFIAASLATTPTYNTILNTIIYNFVRPSHDQLVRVTYSTPAFWTIKTPFLVKLTAYQTGVGGVGAASWNQENKWNETPHVQLFTARSCQAQTSSYENKASFILFSTQPEGGYHSRSSDKKNDSELWLLSTFIPARIKG